MFDRLPIRRKLIAAFGVLLCLTLVLGAVTLIRGIGRTIEGMDALTAQVAAATEEQAAATREIGRAVTEAATGTRDVSRHASGLTEGAQQTGAAGELAQRAESLRGQVDGFLSGIRAA